MGSGGGLVGNVAGLGAALAFRGIRFVQVFVQVPTTLLAGLDSVVLLKQAFNASGGKNLIGAFHAPSMVVTNLEILESLPWSQVRPALRELTKNVLAVDPGGIQWLCSLLRRSVPLTGWRLRSLVERSVATRAFVLRDDPYEKRERLVFEYGHTVGHAIGLVAGERYRRGESVGLGLLAAAGVANAIELLSDREVEVHRSLVAEAGVCPA